MRLGFRLIVVVVFVALPLVSVPIVWLATRQASPTACALSVGGTRYDVSREQLGNATTIAVTAQRLALPHHAVTVALAAALQESGLHNLASGDRDSIGLFQQRPSQGWGTTTQLHDPAYASAAFLKALAGVGSWQALSINDAAQRVQRSGTPRAYGTWAGEARALARALTGEVSGSIRCSA